MNFKNKNNNEDKLNWKDILMGGAGLFAKRLSLVLLIQNIRSQMNQFVDQLIRKGIALFLLMIGVILFFIGLPLYLADILKISSGSLYVLIGLFLILVSLIIFIFSRRK